MPARLTANPGGTLPPDQVVGRGPLIRRYWELLAQQSLLLLAPRRVGKTCICRKMNAENHPGFIRGTPELRDLEGRDRAAELVRLLFEDTQALLPPTLWAKTRARQLLSQLTGSAELKDFKLRVSEQSWPSLMDAVFEALDAYGKEHGKPVVLFWDEFPHFIRDVALKGHPGEATALLDRLRAARQRFPFVRMVLTGSIGLDEVIDGLRLQGYNGDPVNDMAREDVPMLDPSGAQALSTALIRGLGRAVPEPETLAAQLAESCEGHPYLIQHVARRLRYGAEATPEGVDAELTRLIEDAADPLHLHHYLDRLKQLYGPERLALARDILDAVAVSEEGLRQRELLQHLGTADTEAVLEALRSLRRDHYLERDAERRFRFRMRFLQRYWILERDL